MTLIEITFAMGVLLISLLGLLGVTANSMRHERAALLQQIALNAARDKIEEMRTSTNFSSIFSTYNGSTFSVTGLTAPTGSTTIGQVRFPTVGSQLREDTVSDSLSLQMLGTRDLNQDNTTDSFDHSTDYTLLPVLITIDYQGVAGAARYTLVTILRQ
jgi:Tfp pilus assembly protein PilV